MNPLALYLHIPFCKSKCLYCDFYSLSRGEETMDRYCAALSRHLAAWAPRAAGYTVDTVYFGGGTPSYLGHARLASLLETVFRHYRVDPGAEITLEANPDSVGGRGSAAALRAAGFNRVSLGLQSADDGELRAVGRVHTFAQATQAVEDLRAGGFDNLSLDLIYGLPGQELAGWGRTLERTADLGPDHLSCYGLKVEEGTPLWRMRDSLDLPDDDLQADMYLDTVERLARRGDRQYEISNFARPGRESRHNLKYWQLAPYAGFGPGAHSDFGGERYACVRDLEAYCRGIESDGDVLEQRTTISRRERAVEYLMLGLRTVQGVSGQEFTAVAGLPFAPVETALAPFQGWGLAQRENGRWRLTPRGFLVSNQIIWAVLEAI